MLVYQRVFHPIAYPMCLGTRMFQAIMDFDVSEVHLGDFNFQSAKVTLEHLPSAKKAAEALRDPQTDFVQIGRCQPEAAPLGGPKGGSESLDLMALSDDLVSWTLDIPKQKWWWIIFFASQTASPEIRDTDNCFRIIQSERWHLQSPTWDSSQWQLGKKGDGVYLGCDQHV